MEGTLNSLYNLILDRKFQGEDGSYTKYLLNKGSDKILKKLGEECTEVIISSKNDIKEDQINEMCDLIYHLLVLMVDKNINVKDIEEELNRRKNKINNLKGERREVEELN